MSEKITLTLPDGSLAEVHVVKRSRTNNLIGALANRDWRDKVESKPISEAQVVQVLEGMGAKRGIAKTDEAWQGWIVQGSEPELGPHLVLPLKGER